MKEANLEGMTQHIRRKNDFKKKIRQINKDLEGNMRNLRNWNKMKLLGG